MKKLCYTYKKDSLQKEIAMIIYTDRLILRAFTENDAESLYKYASDEDIGPAAGWPAHKSVAESLHVIKTVFSVKETYAICLKEDNVAIGAVGIKVKDQTDMTEKDDECEIGYWLGKPFWGQGIVPEAVLEILRRAFQDLGMSTVWCGHYEGNFKSKRVIEKCGFKYHHTTDEVPVPLLSETRKGHVYYITKKMWKTYQDKERAYGIQKASEGK